MWERQKVQTLLHLVTESMLATQWLLKAGKSSFSCLSFSRMMHWNHCKRRLDHFAAVGALFTTDDTRLTHKPYPAGNGRVAKPKIVTAHRLDITVRFVGREE